MILSNNISNYFNGEFSYPLTKTDKLLSFIDKKEKAIITDLLGYQLAKQFFADLDDGVPQSQKWVDFVNGTEYKNSYLINYEGIIEALQYYLLYFLLLNFEEYNSSSGRGNPYMRNFDSSATYEKEITANGHFNNMSYLYNQAGDYLEYENQNKISKTATSITDNTDGTYTVLLSNTDNLCNYQIIILDDIEYEIYDVILNTSFKINETTGITLNNDFYFYKYYKLATIPQFTKSLIQY